MRIGLDARWFHTGNASGRVWVRNVAETLIRSHPEHTYVLFLKTTDRDRDLPFPAPGVELVFCSTGTGLFANTLILPRAARRAGVEALVTQYFAAPSRRFRQLTVVHDVIFRTDPAFYTPWERAYFAGIRPLLRFADVVITDSESSRKDIEGNGFLLPRQACAVVPCGIHPRFAEAARIEPARIEAFRKDRNLPPRFILYLGRLDERKNVEGLVRALPHLADRDIRLVVSGPDDGGGALLDRTVRDLGLHTRVLRRGICSDADLPLLYRSATLCAYVSRREGFGLPPLESMACGVPVVVSDRPSLPEVCGEAAVYVDPDSPEDIARGLDRVLGDPPFRERLVALGARRASLYTWEKTARLILNAICASQS